ncbi:PREDICTED: eukaryotic translation initiation factor 3 subunit A-like [Dinoponera quadriceps]|uniref:Eukaryotic translation initiation factor 3 subunit A-like n=1 Tax=Dinoponera quadriceps TaxID=609295 RepID=A0A6P3XZ77_DINQU|nr:PREDICTED: eukaryotic translation initiation factor 3 subunit A-like [Dinoponera quadriceps]XP_014483289.1 PREDICTED: eukaryotic translation initiation factor 3 subunit A-like [Dinoponera quadriceps]XP_014483371.1 PREDICTED: eukaryotic translation initiation factor 3 subunit A-like [Dinoponera quadriceps]
MTANNDELSKEAHAVETEVAKGEQNEVLEEHPRLAKEKVKEKPRPKATPEVVKPTVAKIPVKRITPRLEELARPLINNVLVTLRDKAWVLPPAFVDNLTRIIETKTCISPEEAARVLRRKKRKTKKATPPLMKKRTEEVTKLGTPILDEEVAMCQYLLAVNFVRSILERPCQTRRKDLREITRVILKRLTSINGYTDTRDGNDRATQQLQLLAEMIACWIAEILVEVAEAEKETLERYCKKREMKEMEVDDDEETDSEAEYWQQKHEIREKSEKEVKEREKEEKIEDAEDEKVEREQMNGEDIKKPDEDEEVVEGEKEEGETTETLLEE